MVVIHDPCMKLFELGKILIHFAEMSDINVEWDGIRILLYKIKDRMGCGLKMQSE